MAAYNKCLQICFILVQIAFIALGAVLVGLGAWLEIEERSFESAIDNRQLNYGPYLLIAVGCAIIIISFLGIAGAVWDSKLNRFLLILYIILTLVIFAAQLAGGILGFVYRDQVLGVVRDGLNTTLVRFNESTNAGEGITRSWNLIQETFDCCGVSGPDDWLNQTLDFFSGLPLSCCANMTVACTESAAFAQGCEQALSDFVEDNLLIVAAVGIAFILGEVVVVLMAFCLICCTDFDD